jgi:4-hydroxy-tetrahydrodipicolinate reductase
MPQTRLRLAIHGAAGRMGQRLIQLIAASEDLSLAAAVERADHPGLGTDAGSIAGAGPLGVPLARDLPGAADVAIDFSAPAASLRFARDAAGRGIPLVVGTTGFEPAERDEILAHAQRIPLMLSANFSKAVNLLFHLAEVAARAIGHDADIEIVERHHRFKKDAPSGTALRLAEEITSALGPRPLIHGRHGITGERPRAEIGMHALRTGDNPGEHTVVFGLPGECIELSHRALNRDGFARGALDAARFLAGKEPGAYSMRDLLGRSGAL